MDLPFSGDDGASHVITGAARKHYTELARAGKRLDSEEDEVMDNESYTPWIKTCPENSNAKRNANGLVSPSKLPKSVH